MLPDFDFFSTQISPQPQNIRERAVTTASIQEHVSPSSSRNRGREVARDNIEVIKILIERFMRLYLYPEEVVLALLHARIEPAIATLVWKKLEEENAAYFKFYFTVLEVKKQIIKFNQLLMQQYQLMKQKETRNGSSHVPNNNLSAGYTMMQQLPIPSTNGLQINCGVNNLSGGTIMQQPSISARSDQQINCRGTMSNCHVADVISSSSNFRPWQINSENETATDTVPCTPRSAIKSDEDSDIASLDKSGEFPAIPPETQGFSSDLGSTESRIESNGGTGDHGALQIPAQVPRHPDLEL